MSQDQHEIKVIGAAPIESGLEDNKDYQITFNRLGVRRVVKTPLEENGEYKYTYVLENLADIEIKDQDKIIKGKNKSNSKRIRNRCFIYSNDQGLNDEKFYDEFTSKLIRNFDLVVEMLKNK